MPNLKISQLPEDTAPTADDLVVTVNDPGGTPVTKKSTITNFTKAIPAMVGDSGSGGTKGLVPAPGAGDAAAGKFLKADGTYAVPPGTGGSTNPTSTVMPYNNAGTFADSNLTRTSSSVTTVNTGSVIRNSDSGYAYGFTAQTSSGMWLEGTDQLHFSIQAKHVLNIFYQGSSRQCALVEQSQGVLGFGTTTLQAGFYMPAAGHVAVIADFDSPPTQAGTLFSPRKNLETSSSNLVVNMAKGNVRGFTLDNNYTMNAPTNAQSGTILTIRMKQSEGGGNTITWNSAYKFAGGVAPTMTAAANAVDIYTFLLDGTNAEEVSTRQDVK